MILTENQWDKLLKIKTSGRDDSKSDCYNYPYEPTPYPVLERLASSGYIKKNSCVVDYGCGKGRADFFLSYQTRCRSVGIEYDQRIYERAVKNQKTAVSAGKTTFVLEKAENFIIHSSSDCFYFFNPFSVEILQKVMKNIIYSYFEYPRKMRLFFYYPSDEYIAYLTSVNELNFLDEIHCEDLFEGKNLRERILIFELG